VDLGPAEVELWNVIQRHSALLVEPAGLGGWTLKPDGLRLLAEEIGVADRLFLARVAAAMFSEAMKKDEKKT